MAAFHHSLPPFIHSPFTSPSFSSLHLLSFPASPHLYPPILPHLYPPILPQMRCTGIPELTCVEDTDYIRNALVLEKSEHEAVQMFRKVIKKCLDLKWTVQVMWKFHLLRKRGSS